MKRILLLVLLFGLKMVHAQNAPSGNSLNFDGIDDYVAITATAPLDLSSGNFTIETWIKTSSTRAGILAKSNGNATWELGERLFYLEADGSPTFVGYGNEFIRSNQPVNDNMWHHIAVTWNGSTGKIYVDGVDKTSSSNYMANNPDMGTLSLGTPNNGEAVNYFKGDLDQLRLWNVARSATEIFQNYKLKNPATTTGLVANYTFNQGLSNSNNANVSFLNNQLGTDYKGTLNNFSLTGNTSNWIKTSTKNTALSFNVNQFVNVPTASTAVSGSFTVELWVNPRDYNNQAIFSTRQDNGNSFDISMIDGYRIHGDIGNGTNWYTNYADAYPGWSPGTWMHIAYVVSPGNFIIYINGEQRNYGYISNAPLLFNANSTFQIGSNGNEPNFNGLIDEVKIYNTALTQDQVKADMAPTIISKPVNLIAYYDFNQGTPNGDNTGVNTLLDKSARALNGTLTNFTLTGDDANWVGVEAKDMPYLLGAFAQKTRATVTWGESYGASANSYNLDVATDPDFLNLLPAYDGTTITGLSANIKNLQPNTTYYYRLSSSHPLNGESNYSGIDHFTTLPVTTTTANIVLNFQKDNYYNYVELDKSPIANTANFTYETWFRYDGTNAFPRLFDFNNYQGNNVLFGINSSNKLDFYIQSNGNSQNLEGPKVADKDWHHAAVTVENGTWSIYYDGELAAQSSGHTLSPLTLGATQYNWLGRSAYYNDPIFFGSMDDVRIWDVARTALEIKNNYKLTIDPASANLVTNYDFNQGIPGAYNGYETVVFDLTSNNNNGKLIGFGLSGPVSNWINKVLSPVANSANVTNNAITAAWTLPAGGFADSYILDVATDINFSNLVAGYNRLSVTGTSKEITNLQPNTIYYFRVSAVSNADGESGYSNVVASFTQTFEIATAATAITHTSLKANWTTPITTLQNYSYHVEIASDALFTKNLSDSYTTENSIVFNGLNFNTTYYYRVKLSSNEIGETGSSNVITATTITLTPPPGNALDFYNNAGNQVEVTSTLYPTGSTGYTIEAWVNPRDLSSNSGLGIIGYGNYGNVNQVNALRFGGYPGNYELRNYWWANDLSVTVPDLSGKWNHVAATYDNVSGVRSIYLNGVLLGSDNPGANVLNAPSVNIAIGNTNHGEFFNGQMDEVRVFAKARTAAEILADMKSTIPVATPGLVAYYNFDHGFANADNNGGNKLYDQVNEENTGKLINFSLNGTNSNWVPSYAMTAPTAPTATIATATTLSSFVANWQSPAVNATVFAYHIDVASDPNFTTLLPAYTNLQVAGTSITVTGLTEGQTYYYRVRAFNVIGESANSNVISRLVKLDPPGNALAFDGVNDKVIIGSPVSFNATTMKTVEAWVKFADFSNTQEIISKSISSKGLELITYNNNLSVYMMGGGQDNHIDYPLSNLVLNKWYHIATTFNGPGTAMNLYINGVLVGTATAAIGMEDSGAALQLGSWAQDNLRPFKGTIDEVRIWNVQRSEAEIAANFKSIIPANTTGLLAYYNFDQGDAGATNTAITTLNDLGPNNITGTINNFALTGNTSNLVASFALVHPVALPASLVNNSSFTANWETQTFPVITSYKIDVATDAAFVNMLPSYTDLEVTNSGTLLIGNLQAGATYYYRVRAANDLMGSTINSNVESLNTIPLTHPGNALAFNQVNNQHVELPGTTPYNFGTGDFTFEAYVNTTNNGTQIALGNNGNGGDYWFGTDYGRVAFSISGQYLQGSKIIADGKWHHITAVRSQGIGSIYVDGVLEGTLAMDNNADVNSNLSISGFSNGDYAWSGLIDEVRIYNAALTVAQINADMTSTAIALPASLLAYYNFDQGVAGADNTLNTTLYDQSPNAYHGALIDFDLTGTSSNFVKSYALVKPTANAASLITTTGFTANWTASTVSTADKYYVDVATDADFNTIVAQLETTATSLAITGLNSYTNYFYRVMAFNNNIVGQSLSSNTQTLRTLSPNAELSNIVLSAGTLAPVFQTATLAYTANVVSTVTTLKLTSTTTAVSSTIAINGNAVASGTASQSYPLVIGENTFNIVVTAQDGTTTKTYVVKVTRAKTDQAITFAATVAKTYGDVDFLPGATSTNTDYANHPITYSSSDEDVVKIIAGQLHIVKAGTVVITANQVGDATFNAAPAKQQTITISPKTLTISANNASRLQGAANPTFTIAYSAFAPGENNTFLTTQPVAGTLANATSLPGTYDINVTGATATNYAISQVKGTLTVNAAVITNVTLNAVPLYENSPANTAAGALVSASNDPAGTYTYTLVSGTGSGDNGKFNIFGNTIRTNTPLDYEAQATYFVRVKTTSQYGVTFEKELIINLLDVNEAPTLDVIANNTICYTTTAQTLALSGITPGPETTQTTTISVTSTNPGLFETLTPTKTGTNGTINYRVKNNVSGTATVTVTIKDDGGTDNGGVNTFSRSFVITVNALPVIAITSDKGTTVSKGETIKLTASGGSTYVWTANNSIIGGQNTATLTVRPAVTTTYTVTATNSSLCSDVKTITIVVEENFAKVKPMNILTPNGDGYNDTWIVENIDFYPSNVVTIVDKAGRIVYTKKGYDNRWDGTYKGAPLKEDTYYYIIDFGDKFLKIKGFITIVRSN